MSDILIIAPTASFTRDPSQKQINDVIKDQTDAINLEQKLDPEIPEGTNHGPKDIEVKSYHDMRPVRYAVPKQDKKARDLWFAKYYSEGKNIVSYPDMQEDNLKYIRGF